MNWKLTAGLIGGYLALSWLRKRKAITINKDDAAGAVVAKAADQGDQIVAVTKQVTDAVAAKVGMDAPAGKSAGPTDDEQVLATIF